MVPIIVATVWLQVVTMIPPLNRSLRGSHFDASLFQTSSRTSRYLLSWMIFQRAGSLQDLRSCMLSLGHH